MEETLATGVGVPEKKGLSQVERVVDAFVEPSKTFTDILRSTSWWLPFLLILIVTAASAFAIDRKIGFDRVTEQAVQQSPKTSDQLAALPPDQRAVRMSIATVITRDSAYAGGVFLLLIAVIVALVNWASFNFGLGAKTTFGQNFAVFLYAYLPHLILGVLNIIFVCLGVNTENFDMNNPVGTNIGYYLSDSPHWMRVGLSFFDIFGLWSLALMVIGMAIISRKSKGHAAMIVVGWWAIALLLMAGLTAVRG